MVAKIFFSPPSVYAAKIQAEVQRQRRNIVLGAEAADNGSKIAAAAELQAAAEASDFILVPKTLAEQEPFEERRKMNRRVANRRAERPKIVSFRPRSAKTLPSRAVSARA